jgi:hypothetical protein
MTNRNETHSEHAPSASRAMNTTTLGGGYLDDEAYEHVREQALRTQRVSDRQDCGAASAG